MRNVGLRRLLPAFVFVAIAALLLVQTLDERVVARRTLNFYLQPPSGISDPIIRTHAMPVPVGVMSILTLPGLLPFALLGISPVAEGARTPISLAVIVGLTALAWYLVGRWFDRRHSFPARTAESDSFPLLNWILLAMWIAAVSVVTTVLLRIDFLGEMQWLAAGAVLWGVFVGVAIATRIRDRYLQIMDAKDLG